LEPVLAYILILLTVGVVALLPSLLASPARPSTRSIETDDLADSLDSVVITKRVLAEVD
jgi:hypothetical protein